MSIATAHLITNYIVIYFVAIHNLIFLTNPLSKSAFLENSYQMNKMNTRYLFIVVTFGTLLFSSSIHAQESNFYFVAVKDLSLRESNNIKSNRITWLHIDDKLEKINSVNDWLKVKVTRYGTFSFFANGTATPKELVGWIHKKYVLPNLLESNDILFEDIRWEMNRESIKKRMPYPYEEKKIKKKKPDNDSTEITLIQYSIPFNFVANSPILRQFGFLEVFGIHRPPFLQQRRHFQNITCTIKFFFQQDKLFDIVIYIPHEIQIKKLTAFGFVTGDWGRLGGTMFTLLEFNASNLVRLRYLRLSNPAELMSFGAEMLLWHVGKKRSNQQPWKLYP